MLWYRVKSGGYGYDTPLNSSVPDVPVKFCSTIILVTLVTTHTVSCGGGNDQTNFQSVSTGSLSSNPFIARNGSLYSFEFDNNQLAISCDNSDQTFQRSVPDFTMQVSVAGNSARFRPVINSPFIEPVDIWYTRSTNGFSASDSESNPPDLDAFSTVYEELNGVVEGTTLSGYFSISGSAYLNSRTTACYGDILFTAEIVGDNSESDGQSDSMDGVYDFTVVSTISNNGTTACLGGAGSFIVRGGSITGQAVSDWGYVVSLSGDVSGENRVINGTGGGGGHLFDWQGNLLDNTGTWTDSSGCRGTWVSNKA